MLTPALVALGSGSAAAAHKTSSQTYIAPFRLSQNPSSFFDVRDILAVVR